MGAADRPHEATLRNPPPESALAVERQRADLSSSSSAFTKQATLTPTSSLSAQRAMFDVKLPPIRSISGFDERPLSSSSSSHILAPIDASTSSVSPGPSVIAPTSHHATAGASPSAAAQFTSFTRYSSDSRLRPDRQLSEVSPHRQARRVDCSPERGPVMSVDDGDSLPASGVPSMQQSSTVFAVAPMPPPAPYHPFFDAGRKEELAASRKNVEGMRAQFKTTLFQAAHYLSIAHNLLGDGHDHYDGTSEDSLDIVRNAKRYAGHALQLLNNVLERSGSALSEIDSSTPSRTPTCRILSDIGDPCGASWDDFKHTAGPGRPTYQEGVSAVPKVSSQQVSTSQEWKNGSEPAYRAQDKEASEIQARPPVNVYRLGEPHNSSSLSHPSLPSRIASQDFSVDLESERSYIYAPATLRNRLAALHKSGSREAPSAQRADAHVRLPSSHSVDSYPARWQEQANPLFSGAEALSGYDAIHEHTMQPPYHRSTFDDDRFGPHHSIDGSGSSKYKKRSRAPAPAACKNCGTNETPEWRRGPDGARTLCNACGLHFAKMVKKKGSLGDGSGPEEQLYNSNSSSTMGSDLSSSASTTQAEQKGREVCWS